MMAIMQNEAQEIAKDWLVGSEYEVNKLNAGADKIEIVISGDEEVPSFDELVMELEEITKDELWVNLNAV